MFSFNKLCFYYKAFTMKTQLFVLLVVKKSHAKMKNNFIL